MNREELDTFLDTIDSQELSYVMFRSRESSDAAAYKAAGISRSSWYRIEEDHRDRLNEAASELRKNRAIEALRIYDQNAVKAAEVIAKQLGSDNENVAQRAAFDIMDRVTGKPTTKVEADVTSDGKAIVMRWPEDDGD